MHRLRSQVRFSPTRYNPYCVTPREGNVKPLISRRKGQCPYGRGIGKDPCDPGRARRQRRNYTVSEAIDRLCREELSRLRHPKKALSHIRAVESYAGDSPLKQISDVAVRYRLAHAHLAVATCNRRLAVLRRVAWLAYRRWGWLRGRPTSNLRRNTTSGIAI